MEQDDLLCFYLQAYIVLPAAVLVSFLAAYDCVTWWLFQNTRSWLCRSTPLPFFDLLTESNLDEARERQIEQRCLWYHVHIARPDAKFLQNTTSKKNERWRQIRKAINSGTTPNHGVELNQLLLMIIKCCLIRLQETPKFLHEDYPQPRGVLHAFLFHSIPLLLKLDSKSKDFLCRRLESLMLLLGMVQVHDSMCYSVRRLFRQHDLSRETDYSGLPSWRFNFWMLLRSQQQIHPMLVPSLALHLGLHPSLSLQLLSEIEVVASYIKGSKSLLEASRLFVRDLSDAVDAFDVLDARKDALCCLYNFDTAFMDSVNQPTCDEILMPSDDASEHNREAVQSDRQFSHNLDFIEAQLHISSAYLYFGANEEGLQRLETVCELVDESLSRALNDISHSIRSLALVAWARCAVKKQANEERGEPSKPDNVRLLGEQLFSIHLELKASPTKGALFATSARLGDALSGWKREFAEYSTPPCWTKCRNEIISLIWVSRIGFQALDSVSTHFFSDDPSKQQRSDFEWIFSTLSQHFSDSH